MVRLADQIQAKDKTVMILELPETMLIELLEKSRKVSYVLIILYFVLINTYESMLYIWSFIYVKK